MTLRLPRALRCATLAASSAFGGACALAATGVQPETTLAAADARPALPASPDANGVLYLEVSINGTSTQRIAQFFVVNQMLYITQKELTELGIRADDLPADANGRVSLEAVPGLRYRYRPERQRIDLEATDERRVPAALGNAEPRPPVAATGTGLVVNYEFSAQPQAPSQYGLYTEERFFYPGGIFDNTGTAYAYNGQQKYIRLDTAWSHSNPQTMLTTRVGDTISSALSWSRPVRLGGFQVSRDFSLRPDLITYPVPTLAGSSAVPSSVDLYVNNVRQYSGATPSGPFVINAVPSVNGAGEAVIVTRDVLGRSVMTTVPLYIDSRMLSTGLTDFSVEAGFVRRGYTLYSFDYAGEPALSASIRRGMTSTLTLEGHTELTRGVYNAGGGALFGFGEWGVANASFAASAGSGGDRQLAPVFYNGYYGPNGLPYDPNGASAQTGVGPQPTSTLTPGGSGVQFAFGWQYRTSALSIDLQAQRATPHYSDLASSEGTPVPRATYRATVAAPFRALGIQNTASASYVGLDDPYYGNSRIGSLAFTMTLPANVSLAASVYHDFGDSKNTGFFAALSFPIGGSMNANLNVGSDQGKPLFGAAVTKTPDYGGGFGWQVQATEQNGYTQSLGQASYRGRYGDIIGSVARTQSRTYSEIDASGSLVVMAGDVLAGRRIDDAFALVSTDGVRNVPVLHENRVIGETNGAGHFLVPDLIAYEPNHLAIDPLGLPANTDVKTTQLNLAPQSRAGVLARFPLNSFSGAQLSLADATGKPLPPGATVTSEETSKQYVVGYDGLAFIDDLKPKNHLVARWTPPQGEAGGPQQCDIDVPYDGRGNASLPTLGPFSCEAPSR